MIIDRVLLREEKASPNTFSIFSMQLYARLCKNKLNAIHFNATSEKDHADRGNFQNIYRVLSQALLMQHCKKLRKMQKSHQKKRKKKQLLQKDKKYNVDGI